MTIDIRGRNPVSVQQGSGNGNDYPFVDPSEDVALLLGDLYLAYSDADCGFRLPFRIDWMYGFGDQDPSPYSLPTDPAAAHAYDLRIVDADGVTVFDTTTATRFLSSPWGTRLRVLQWLSAGVTLRCTLHTAWKVDPPPRRYARIIRPASGEIDGRTYERVIPRLTGLIVNGQRLTGVIEFQEGYNVSLAATEAAANDGGRRVASIVMHADPGAGLGKSPGCEAVESVIRRINQVGPDPVGNFLARAQDCFRLESGLPNDRLGTPPSLSAGDLAAARATIGLSNDCTPCNDCSYFVRVYRGLLRVRERWAEVGRRAEAVRNQLRANTLRWAEARDCRLDHPLQTAAFSRANCGAFVGSSYCNPTDCCLRRMEFRFTFQRYQDGAPENAIVDAIPSDGAVNDRDAVIGGRWPVYRLFVDSVESRGAATAQMRLRVPCDPRHTLRIIATVHAVDPLNDSGDPCGLPSMAVNAGLRARWAQAGIVQSQDAPVVAMSDQSIPLDPRAITHRCD